MTEEVPLKPLSRVEKILGELQLEITYAYDDLVFVEHNAFLLRMGEKGSELALYFNSDSDPEKRPEIASQLSTLAKEQGIDLTEAGTFSMSQKNDEEMELVFDE